MKNLTKIFMAVCVAMFAFACATDPTDDLGVNVGAGGQTSLTLSLEGTKTHLGAEGSESYPLYWSEGDAITVNGYPSDALSAEEAGKTCATFTFNGVSDLGEVYNIVYPVAPINQVKFADVQTHISNTTVGKNATTLYGVGSKENGAKLHHLTGILKIGVTGSATLTHAQISTIDRAPIAGTFDIDFTTGDVTPTELTTPIINYSFDGGVELSDTPTYMHVAVPEGVYKNLYITLYDNEYGVMYVTVAADDDKPLTAGVIRTFTTNIPYQQTTKLHVIKDAASLKALPNATSDAVVVCDIDLSDEKWTPLTGYTGTLNGNGYAIKGLTAPLFESTSATIKGLHLEGVNITDSTLECVAALVGTYNGSNISNCSASGAITLTRAETSNSKIGGLVGKLPSTTSCSIVECTNNCAVSVTLTASEGTANGINHIGGVLARTEDGADTIITVVEKCKNTAPVSVEGSIAISDSGLRIGGVVGSFGYQKTTIDGCSNSAAINVNLDKSEGTLRIGGVMGSMYRATSGYSTFTFAPSNCSNSGNITINATNYKAASHLGGVFGTVCDDRGVSMLMDNCHNSGTLTVTGGTASGKLYAGGVTGWIVNAITMQNCQNAASGSVSVTLDNIETNECVFGGLVGYARCLKRSITSSTMNINNCQNHATVTGNINTSNAPVVCGGCFGKLFSFTSHVYNITVDNLDNYGSVVANLTDQTGPTYVGGIIGGITEGCEAGASSSFVIKNSDNFGSTSGSNKVHVTNGTYADLYAGGVVGRTISHLSVDNCTNSMPVLFDATSATMGAIAGLFGSLYYSYNTTEYSLVNSSNSAEIKADLETLTTPLLIGGCVGQITSKGDTTKDGKTTNGGRNYRFHLNNVDNSGSVVVDCTSQTGSKLLVLGGVVGGIAKFDTETDETFAYATQEDSLMKIEWCDNVGAANSNNKIHVTNGAYNYLHAGGIIGYSETPFDVDNCSNSMKFLLDADKCTSTNMYGALCSRITQVVGDITTTINNFTNSGDIYITPITSLSGYNVYAGCLSYCSVNDKQHAVVADNVINRGNINLTSQKITNGTFIGGFAGCFTNENSLTMTNSHNYGKINFSSAAVSHNVFIGGFAGATQNAGADLSFTDCHNEKDATININITCKTSGKNQFFGGLLGLPRINLTLKNCSNKAAVTVTGHLAAGTSSYVTLGGLIGRHGATDSGTMSLENVSNSGNISLGTKESPFQLVKSFTKVGGIIGDSNLTNCGFKNPVHNTGNVSVVTDASVTTSEAIEKSLIGGIIGNTPHAIENARCYCTVTAYNLTKTTNPHTATPLPNVGMITGSPYSETVTMKNCHIGGAICNGYLDNGDLSLVEYNDYDYYDFIYGNSISGPELLNSCGWLEKNINDIPIDAEGLPIVIVQ